MRQKKTNRDSKRKDMRNEKRLEEKKDKKTRVKMRQGEKMRTDETSKRQDQKR